MYKLVAKKLTPGEQEQLISKKLAWILQACSPERIVLFGSAARGEMTTASDIDLALIFNTDIELKAARSNVYRSRPKDDWPHDILFYTADSLKLSAAQGGGAAYLIETEGKTLFQRGQPV